MAAKLTPAARQTLIESVKAGVGNSETDNKLWAKHKVHVSKNTFYSYRKQYGPGKVRTKSAKPAPIKQAPPVLYRDMETGKCFEDITSFSPGTMITECKLASTGSLGYAPNKKD